MRPRDYLKVLSALKHNEKIDVAEIAKQTQFSRAEVKRALKYLCQSAIISNLNKTVKINFCPLNAN